MWLGQFCYTCLDHLTWTTPQAILAIYFPLPLPTLFNTTTPMKQPGASILQEFHFTHRLGWRGTCLHCWKFLCTLKHIVSNSVKIPSLKAFPSPPHSCPCPEVPAPAQPRASFQISHLPQGHYLLGSLSSWDVIQDTPGSRQGYQLGDIGVEPLWHLVGSLCLAGWSLWSPVERGALLGTDQFLGSFQRSGKDAWPPSQIWLSVLNLGLRAAWNAAYFHLDVPHTAEYVQQISTDGIGHALFAPFNRAGVTDEKTLAWLPPGIPT